MPNLVSIIVACYNAEKFIAETLESLCSQSYQNIEIIVVDDCSTDLSLSIIKNAALYDSRIRLISNQSNLGPAASRNFGIEKSSGRYIAICDADDTWSSNKLDIQLSILKATGASIIGASVQIVDSEGKYIRAKHYYGELAENYQTFKAFPPHSSILFDQATLPWKLRYDPRYQLAEDYKLLLDYSRICRVVSANESFVKYRVHSNNITKRTFCSLGQVGWAIMARVNFDLEESSQVDASTQSKLFDLIVKSRIEANFYYYQAFKTALHQNSIRYISLRNIYWLLREVILASEPRLVLALDIIKKLQSAKQLINIHARYD